VPRNGSGTMSLATTISPSDQQSSTVVMTMLNDVRDALTASLATDGQSTMTVPLKAADGSASAPGYTFGSDLNTGAYRISADTVGFAANGAEVWRYGTGGITLASGKTLTVGSVTNAHVPAGVIVMWSGTVATIPTGWLICDGTNGTPDLRDRFVIGARQDDAGAAKTNVTGSLTVSGGSKDAIVVSHDHTATSTVTDPGHNHQFGTFAGASAAPGNQTVTSGTNQSTNTKTTGVTVATTVDSAGDSGTNANLPPYYALAFIMKA